MSINTQHEREKPQTALGALVLAREQGQVSLRGTAQDSRPRHPGRCASTEVERALSPLGHPGQPPGSGPGCGTDWAASPFASSWARKPDAGPLTGTVPAGSPDPEPAEDARCSEEV